MNFNFQQFSTFVFFVSRKKGMIAVAYPFNIYQDMKFQDPTLTDANSVPTSEVWTSPSLEWFKIRD
jgi:hypothetical protein